MSLDPRRFPIGAFSPPAAIAAADISAWITRLELLPQELAELVANLSAKDLEKTYRDGSWTITQVIHHIADSHTNSLIRFKWALTEDEPLIKAYFEDRWANLHDYSADALPETLAYISLLHKRLCRLLRGLSATQLKRTFIHPETGNTVVLDWNIGQYAWHGDHHLAHIRLALSR